MAIEKVVNVKVQEQGFDDLNAKVRRLEDSLEDLEQQNQSLRGSLASSGKSVLDNGGAMGLLNDATGGLAMTVKDAVEATDLFTKSTKAQTVFQKIATTVIGTSTGAMKAFKIALISTGIGAIVVAIGLLIANFDKVKKVVMNVIPGLKLVGDFIGGIIETITDFIGVTSDATRQIDKMVSDSQASLKRSEHFLEANGDKYDEYTQRKIKANIDYNKKVKELAEDEELTEQEKLKRMADFRLKANREIEKADADRFEANRKRREEEQNKINEENKRAYEAQQQRLKEQQQKDFEVAMAGADARREFLKEREERNKEYLQQIADEEEENILREVQNLVELEREKARLQNEADQLALQSREAFEQAKRNALDTGLNILMQFAGKNKAIALSILAIQKGLAIADVVVGASKAIGLAKFNLAQIPVVLPPGVPNPAFKIQAGATLKSIATTKIGAATSIASILAAGIGQASQITAGGNVGDGGSGGSGGGVGVAPSAPSFNLVGGTGTNQIAQSLAMQNKPIQAFVVGSAVTNQQELDRRAVSNATL
jgi:hypothetical protein